MRPMKKGDLIAVWARVEDISEAFGKERVYFTLNPHASWEEQHYTHCNADEIVSRSTVDSKP